MATPASSFDRFIRAGAFRHARCYAPEPVMTLLADVVAVPGLALVLDVDTLERSALAKFDRVMSLALGALRRAGVDVILTARYECARAAFIEHAVPGSRRINVSERALPASTIVAISDDPVLFAALTDVDRGIALGRPELARPNVVAAGDASVRATLWWMLEARSSS
jgi:hypothetical protein